MNNPPYIFGPEAIKGLIKVCANDYRIELCAGLRQLVRERKTYYKTVHKTPPKSDARLAALITLEKNIDEICQKLKIGTRGCHFCHDTEDKKNKWFLFFHVGENSGHISFENLYAKGRNPTVWMRNGYTATSKTRVMKLSELAAEIVREEMKKHLKHGQETH